MVVHSSDATRKKLASQLLEQLRKDCDEARSIGYVPSKFLSMISKDGPVEACRQVVMTNKIPDGFMTLLSKNRLDLTAEATILKRPWRGLFEEDVLEYARDRLRKFKRPDLIDE